MKTFRATAQPTRQTLFARQTLRSYHQPTKSAFLNIFPFALNGDPCIFLHFSSSLAFFSMSFARRVVKRLRASFGFVFGNHSVHFFHASGWRIVFEKCRITLR